MRGIYYIKNKTNNKFYVGQSIDIETRIKRHKRTLKNGTHHNKHLQKSFNKYGENNFEYGVLYEANEDDNLDELEMKYIESTGAFEHGYNSTKGGKGDLGMIVTDEFRMRMSELVKGEKNPNYGHKWTPEMKAHLSKKFSDGSRKGANNVRAIKVIRVEDCKIYPTQTDAAIDLNLNSVASIDRCVQNKEYIAGGFHFALYSDEMYQYLVDENNRFEYLCECYKIAKKPFIVNLNTRTFYGVEEFVKK